MPSAKILEEKKTAVANLVEKLKTAQSGVLVDYRGLTVEEDTDLRNKLRQAGVEYKVVKNTLTRFAAKEVGFDGLDDVLNGPTSMALSFEDPVAPAKILYDYSKQNENLEIKAGFLDGKILTLDEIKTLASTPSREVLLATILSSLNAPVSKLVRTLQAIVDKGETTQEEPAAEEAVEAPVETKAEEVAEVAEAPVEEAPAETAEEAKEE